MNNKIFCLGFHKTGTRSWRDAMRILGYSNVQSSHDEFLPYLKEDNLEPIFKFIDKFSAFRNWPFALMYKDIYKFYFHSKFVLTVRNEQDWLDSSLRHFYTQTTPMREYIFGKGKGAPRGNEKRHLEIYKKHNNNVINFFTDRGSLLVMDITQGDGWDKLCNFLDLPIPPQKFPYANKHKLHRKLR